jgi:hypothetical protein
LGSGDYTIMFDPDYMELLRRLNCYRGGVTALEQQLHVNELMTYRSHPLLAVTIVLGACPSNRRIFLAKEVRVGFCLCA